MKTIREADSRASRLLPAQKPDRSILYVPSQFAFAFEEGGRHYVFSTLTKQCVESVLPDHARAGEGFDDLIESRFLVPQGLDECAIYEGMSRLYRIRTKKNHITSFTVLPTTACNARCVYCYEAGMKQVTMTPEIADQTVRFILENHPEDKVHIGWYGGEPTMFPDIIDRITEGIQAAGETLEATMISNASLITEALADRMAGPWNLKMIQISMDGSEQDYIARKKYPSYHDYYHAAIRSANMLSKRGIRVSIRCNVDEENIDHLEELMQDLSETIEDRERVSIYFCPLFQVRIGENDLAMWKRIVDAHSTLEQYGIRIQLPLKPSNRFRITRCMVDANGVVIGPDGSLYVCEHMIDSARVGDIFHGITEPEKHAAFTDTEHTREECRSCTFLPECTSLASCPTRDTHCKEVFQLTTAFALKRFARGKENVYDPELRDC